MDNTTVRGKENIGFTYKVDLNKLHQTIKETEEDGEPMENFIEGKLGLRGDNNSYSYHYHYPNFFIYNYDEKTGEFWLSNGNRVTEDNLCLLYHSKIISKPEIKLENE